MKFKTETISYSIIALALIINSLGDISSDRFRHENDLMIVEGYHVNDSTILRGSYEADSAIIDRLHKLEDKIEKLENDGVGR